MPLYEYIDPATGQRTERVLPVARRDEFPGRVTVPRRLNVLTKAGKSEGEWQADEVLRGFHKLEQSDPHANDKMREGLGMSPDKIKDVWAQPDTHYVERPGELVQA